ncbi:MAG: asparagine synthase-related protein [Candidatus Pacebacteria bacterium]|nr:asparagine synthase-related protein [Candidatus Paceibacterota bacterium]
MNLVDLRKIKPLIFNKKELENNFKNGFFDEMIKSEDSIAYKKYKQYGDEFLHQIDGEFAYVFYDKTSEVIFATRDWIGEMPLHYAISGENIYFANFVSDLLASSPELKYENVVAVNRSEVVEVDAKTKIVQKHLYYNFNKENNEVDYDDLKKVAKKIHDLLFEAVKIRLPKNSKKTAILLSGGIDSMSIAYIVSVLRPNIPAYTIEVASQQSTDLTRAYEITKAFGLNHRIINVSEKEIIDCVKQAISDSEIYHMYNVFCAVGMHKLASVLKNDKVDHVFTGEGGNEAFGDYHDWIVIDPKTKKEIVLQTTSKDFNEPEGREAYIWGNLISEAKGRYNIQLGSGLGKHGGSRMYKPMFKQGIYLLSPYLEKSIMKMLANIPSKILNDIGGKAGFMRIVFDEEVRAGKIPERFFIVKKIRFQDASDGGEGGITGTLLGHGYNQEKLIEIFNTVFHAHVEARPHLKETILIK